jgi:hypothetical protein
MRDHKSHAQRASRELWPYRPFSNSRRSPLAEERHILELISLGTPLSRILINLCAAMDFQIGNVVSHVFLSNRGKNDLYSVTQSATQFGLNVFASTRILSPDRTRLGTLQIYGCERRYPTPNEYQLIRRLAILALAVLQQYKGTEDFEGSPGRSRNETDVSELGRSQFIN